MVPRSALGELWVLAQYMNMYTGTQSTRSIHTLAESASSLNTSTLETIKRHPIQRKPHHLINTSTIGERRREGETGTLMDELLSPATNLYPCIYTSDMPGTMCSYLPRIVMSSEPKMPQNDEAIISNYLK